MEIKYKLYPYPVLSPYSNDYKEGIFQPTIDIVRDGYNLRIDFVASLTSKSLLECIRTGVAKYVYHIECAQTGFRTVVQTDKVSEVYTLLSKSVNGKLQICPCVVAVKDITGYSSPEFHDDYKGLSFDIEAGCVMAVGKMYTVDITKDIDDLANTPSIFNITRNPDPSCKQMLVDMSQRKIIIKLPMNDFYSYKALSTTPQAQAILNSLTVVPALVYVLEELRAMSPQERSENSDTLWYKVLSKALLTQFDCDIEDEAFDTLNFMILAQKLINDPLSDAFAFMTSSFGVAGGDE